VSALSLDKSQVWWGFTPTEGKIHAILRTHTLCDSTPATDHIPYIDTTQRDVCLRCLTLLNTATHDTRGAHYGGS